MGGKVQINKLQFLVCRQQYAASLFQTKGLQKSGCTAYLLHKSRIGHTTITHDKSNLVRGIHSMSGDITQQSAVGCLKHEQVC